MPLAIRLMTRRPKTPSSARKNALRMAAFREAMDMPDPMEG